MRWIVYFQNYRGGSKYYWKGRIDEPITNLRNWSFDESWAIRIHTEDAAKRVAAQIKPIVARGGLVTIEIADTEKSESI